MEGVAVNKEQAGLATLAAVENLSGDEMVRLVRLMRQRYKYNLTDKPKAARNTLTSCQPLHCYEVLRELADCQDLVPAETIIAKLPLIKKKLAELHITPIRPPKIAAKTEPLHIVTQSEARRQLFEYFSDEELWKIFLRVAGDNLNLKPRYLSQATIRTCSQRMVGANLLYRSLNILLGLGANQIEYAKIIALFPQVRERLAWLPKDRIKGGRKSPWLSETTAPPMPENLIVRHTKLGEILITHHAWIRFCYRYCRTMNRKALFNEASEDEMRQQLRELLARAELEVVDPGTRVIRIINNGFQPAYYLRACSHNLRFVVSETDSRNPKPLLLTVEIAVRGARFVSAEPK